MKPGANGLYTDSTGRAFNQAQFDKVGQTFNHYADALGRLQVGTDRYDNVAKRAERIGKQYGFDTSKLLPTGWKIGYKPPAPPAPITTNPAPQTQQAAPQSITSQANSYQSPMTSALLKALGGNVNTLSAYEPQSFEGSPMYQFQKQKGLKDMERLMAARGLTNSGAEIEANSNFLADLNATEAEKQRGYAEKRMDRQSDMMRFIAGFDQSERKTMQDQLNADLDRRINAGQFEATRGDAASRANQNMLMELLRIQAQNQIPNISTSGDKALTDYTVQLKNAIAAMTANAYPRQTGGGAPPPQAPYVSNADVNSILANSSQGNDQNDLITSLLGSFGF